MNPPPGLVRPLPLRVLVDEAIRQLRRNFKVLYPPIAIPLALLVVPATFFYVQRIAAMTRFSPDDTASELVVAFAGMGLAFALMMGAHYAAWGACIPSTMDTVCGRPVDMLKSWLWMLRPRVFGPSS